LAKRGRRPSATRRSWARALASSGCSKMERMAEATMPCTPFMTRPSALRVACTRQRCQALPRKVACTAATRAGWASLMTSRTPLRPRALSERRKGSQLPPSSPPAAATSTPSTLRSPAAMMPLHQTLIGLNGIEEIELRLGNDCAAFFEWIQVGPTCHVLTAVGLASVPTTSPSAFEVATCEHSTGAYQVGLPRDGGRTRNSMTMSLATSMPAASSRSPSST
jgi:hypothetical protein